MRWGSGASRLEIEGKVGARANGVTSHGPSAHGGRETFRMVFSTRGPTPAVPLFLMLTPCSRAGRTISSCVTALGRRNMFVRGARCGTLVPPDPPEPVQYGWQAIRSMGTAVGGGVLRTPRLGPCRARTRLCGLQPLRRCAGLGVQCAQLARDPRRESSGRRCARRAASAALALRRIVVWAEPFASRRARTDRSVVERSLGLLARCRSSASLPFVSVAQRAGSFPPEPLARARRAAPARLLSG